MSLPDPRSNVSAHFLWHEVLWLPHWNRLATEADGVTLEVLDNAASLATRLDLVREQFGAPLMVHCWYRPEQYNQEVQGAPSSAHLSGMACDFDVVGMACADVEGIIQDGGYLDVWNLRMEHATPSWIHLDSRLPGPGGRIFNP